MAHHPTGFELVGNLSIEANESARRTS